MSGPPPTPEPPNLARRLIWALGGLLVFGLVLVAVTGLLQLETARVWNFMLPLLMIPVGLELGSWTNWQRIAVYATLCLATAAIAQNVKFIY